MKRFIWSGILLLAFVLGVALSDMVKPFSATASPTLHQVTPSEFDALKRRVDALDTEIDALDTEVDELDELVSIFHDLGDSSDDTDSGPESATSSGDPVPGPTATPSGSPVSVSKPTGSDIGSLANLLDYMSLQNSKQPNTQRFSYRTNAQQKWLWGYWWCAIDQATLSNNVRPASIVIRVDGVKVAPSRIRNYSFSNGGWPACQGWVTKIDSWPTHRTTKLEVEFTLSRSINDGSNTYAPGTYKVVIDVTAQ